MGRLLLSIVADPLFIIVRVDFEESFFFFFFFLFVHVYSVHVSSLIYSGLVVDACDDLQQLAKSRMLLAARACFVAL